MSEEKIKELFSNEEFVKDLFKSESYEVAQKKLADNGVVISVEELKKVFELLKKKANGELSDEELEEAAGGMTLVTGTLIAIAFCVGGLMGAKAATCN